jgi:hypothetical protein
LGKQAGRQAGGQAGRQAARQPGSQAARQPGRQAGRQTDRQKLRRICYRLEKPISSGKVLLGFTDFLDKLK